MSLTRRIHKGGMKTKGKKGKGHCNKGGKTMKKGGKNVLVPLAFLTAVLASGKSKKPRKSRKSKKGGKPRAISSHLIPPSLSLTPPSLA